MCALLSGMLLRVCAVGGQRRLVCVSDIFYFVIVVMFKEVDGGNYRNKHNFTNTSIHQHLVPETCRCFICLVSFIDAENKTKQKTCMRYWQLHDSDNF